MKILSVVGARPQFIKAAPLSAALRKRGIREILLHTGQHYDFNMSDIFFRQLKLPKPDVHLGVGSGSHAGQTAQMMVGIETALKKSSPRATLVYGDTNSTLAGALAASKLHIPLIHVEAGLRAYEPIPEEINRVVTDHVSSLLFAPTKTAVRNLRKEGIRRGVVQSGDVMQDALHSTLPIAERLAGGILGRFHLCSRKYILVTIHRPQNADSPTHLKEILAGLAKSPFPVIFPMHPRTHLHLGKSKIARACAAGVQIVQPLGYFEFLALERHARIIVTDSGGVQKEAYMLGVPCVTIRDRTEWVETVETGWNRLVRPERAALARALRRAAPSLRRPAVFGNARAADLIAREIFAFCQKM